MASKKNRKQKRSSQAPKSQRRLFYPALLIFTFLVAIGAGSWLFSHESGKRTDSMTENSTVQKASQGNFHNLVGRWRRPDGGYIIEIREVDPNGQLQAAYFNPRPIHVSQARLSFVNKEPQVFIELRDTGYPGATYTLIYLAEQDILTGLYYQPTASKNFKVVFVRMDA